MIGKLRLRPHRRGMKVSKTRGCRLQASHGKIEVQGSPLPFAPAATLRGRAGIYVKYFAPPMAGGWIFLRGDDAPVISGFPPPAVARAYSLRGKTGDSSAFIRRVNHVFIPISGKVRLRIYVAGPEEFASTLEFS